MSDPKSPENAADMELTPEELDAAVGGASRIKGESLAKTELEASEAPIRSREPLQAKEAAKKFTSR